MTRGLMPNPKEPPQPQPQPSKVAGTAAQPATPGAPSAATAALKAERIAADKEHAQEIGLHCLVFYRHSYVSSGPEETHRGTGAGADDGYQGVACGLQRVSY